MTRGELTKLIAWYIFNVTFTYVGSVLAVGDNYYKGVVTVFLVFATATAVSGYLSVKRLKVGDSKGALKAARNAVPAGLLVMIVVSIAKKLAT